MQLPMRAPVLSAKRPMSLSMSCVLVGLLVAAACEPSGRLVAGEAEPPAGGSHAPGGATTSILVAAGATSGAPAATHSATATAPPELATGGKRAVKGARGMVSSVDDKTSRVGAAILGKGGNAVDAAVAMAWALSATNHSAGSLGGGGFMIIRLASGKSYALDYREVAPQNATVALNNKQLARGAHGYLSAPVPGVVAGLELARERFGSLPREQLIAPAIELAEKGHRYGVRQAMVLGWYWKRVRKDPVLRAIFGRGKKRRKPIAAGQLLKQPSLAKTLRAVAERGRAGFYEGEVAKLIAAAMKNGGGLVTEADLKAYRAKIRQPLTISHRGFEVLTMPPPSMGGIAVASILLGLAQTNADKAPVGSALSLHLYIESARRAYADRRAVGADPDRVEQAKVGPMLKRLLDPAYYAAREPKTDPLRAAPRGAILPIQVVSAPPKESPETTHFSVFDAQGNAVSCTTTLSAAFGAWLVVPQTGVLFSNAMGAFSPSGVNVLAPGKRMASSMSPTIVVSGGKTVAVVGSPGGDTIPGTVAQVLRNLIDYRMTIDAAIDAGRVHRQHKPHGVRIESKRAPSAQVQAQLTKMGHSLMKSPVLIGDANGIVIDPSSKIAWGYSDSRKGGLALGPKSIASR